jgi:hypothetical protein
MKCAISWHENCLKNSRNNEALELARLNREIERLYYHHTENEIKQMQINAALLKCKDGFDDEKFMKTARQNAMEEAKQRLTAAGPPFVKEELRL